MANFGGLNEFLVGRAGGAQQLDLFRPEQENILNQLAQLGISGIQNPTQGFQPIANQAQQNFMQQTVPMLSERFTSGTGGALSSPSFASLIGQAGAGLQSNLAAQEAQFGQNQLSALLPLLQLGLQPQFKYAEDEGEQGLLGQAAPGIGEALGTAAQHIPWSKIFGDTAGNVATGASSGAAVGGPWGAAAGAGLAGLVALFNVLKNRKQR